MKPNLACVGEAMVELARDAEDTSLARIGFAGDTFNTAVYVSRLGGVGTEFVSRVGQDDFSDDLLRFAEGEGVGTHHVARDPERSIGLYAITTDAKGERSFSYWRHASAARKLFDEPAPALGELAEFDVVYYSAITLAIMSSKARQALFDWLPGYRAAGGLVAFDSNYRPALWDARLQAQETIARAWTLCDWALPSVDDEMQIFGDSGESEVIARLRSYGIRDGALKRGVFGPQSLGETVQDQYAPATTILDTTAAGDSFNAGFLWGRINGRGQAEALMAGHELASKVVSRRGAIIVRD